MRTYKIFATINATSDAWANVIIQKNCRVKSVRWEADVDAVADNSKVAVELSTRNTQQINTNDTVGDLSQIRSHANLVTSGLAIGRIFKQEFLDFPVSAQERLYLNAIVTTATALVCCFIDVAE